MIDKFAQLYLNHNAPLAIAILTTVALLIGAVVYRVRGQKNTVPVFVFWAVVEALSVFGLIIGDPQPFILLAMVGYVLMTVMGILMFLFGLAGATAAFVKPRKDQSVNKLFVFTGYLTLSIATLHTASSVGYLMAKGHNGGLEAFFDALALATRSALAVDLAMFVIAAVVLFIKQLTGGRKTKAAQASQSDYGSI